jgi:hypothetical protein
MVVNLGGNTARQKPTSSSASVRFASTYSVVL